MWWILLVAVVLYGAFEIYRSRTSLQTEEFHIVIPSLPEEAEGYRIAFLSDIHNEGPLTKAEKAILREKPDLVVFGGDLLHKKRGEMGRVMPLVKALSKRFPTVMALGNHEELVRERFPEKWDAFFEECESAGVTILQNEWMNMKGFSLGAISVDAHKYYHPKGHTPEDYIDGDMMKNCPEGVKILLAHDPLQMDIYTAWGMDLVLSGHIHGGVVRVPFIGALLSPARNFFPVRANGLYQKENTQMVVSRGIGNKAFLPRFWNRPHLPIIILHRGEKE